MSGTPVDSFPRHVEPITARGCIHTEDVPRCLVCGHGGSPLYAGLRDQPFESPGEWAFSRCPQCGFVWLSPRPSPQDLPKAYANYYTHGPQGTSRWDTVRERILLGACGSLPGCEKLAPNRAWRLVGKALRLIPTVAETSKLMVRGLEGRQAGSLLDIGCGSGEFLSLAQKLGWQVSGVEVDPAAAEQARSRYGICATVGTLEEAAFPTNHFEAINLGHVIEHLYDPVGFLSECRRVLKVGGRLFLTTPNVDSLGHLEFQECWRGLEPPRHFHLFSPKTLQTCTERSGLRVKTIRTSAQTGPYVWRCSVSKGLPNVMTWRLRFGGWAFRAREERALRTEPAIGEEIVLVAEKGFD